MTVNITSPLYSLKDSAINVILRCLPVNSDRFNQAAYELEIPRQLQEELLLTREARAWNTQANFILNLCIKSNINIEKAGLY